MCFSILTTFDNFYFYLKKFCLFEILELESVERDEEVSISLIVLVCVISVLFIGAILITVAIIRTKRDSDQTKFMSGM